MATNARDLPTSFPKEDVYPWNWTKVYPDGTMVTHVVAEGKTMFRWSHGNSSTFMEVDHNGKTTVFSTGDTHMYHKSGVTTTIDHNGDVNMAGCQRLTVEGGSHIEVRGDAAISVGGDSTTVVAGNMQAAVAGSGYMSTAGPMSMNFAGDLDMQIGGKTTIKSGGDIKMNAPNIYMNS